jgi:hypothetical protein
MEMKIEINIKIQKKQNNKKETDDEFSKWLDEFFEEKNKEQRKQIDDTDDYYVSNKGRVKRILENGTERILKGWDNGEYMRIKINGQCFLIHRIVATAFLPNPDNLPVVDHKNHDGYNNKVENLRWATVSQNNQNRRKSTNLYLGICKKYNKWTAQTRKDGKKHYIGIFDTEIEASKAYDRKAKELFGPDARVNNK